MQCCFTNYCSFINQDNIDFSNVKQFKSIQDWDLHEDFKGEYEYPTKIAKFSSVTSLTMYIPTNFGAETTRIDYIGLKGDYFEAYKREAVITAYESKPQMQDHQTKADQIGGISRQGF